MHTSSFETLFLWVILQIFKKFIWILSINIFKIIIPLFIYFLFLLVILSFIRLIWLVWRPCCFWIHYTWLSEFKALGWGPLQNFQQLPYAICLFNFLFFFNYYSYRTFSNKLKFLFHTCPRHLKDHKQPAEISRPHIAACFFY